MVITHKSSKEEGVIAYLNQALIELMMLVKEQRVDGS